MSTPRESLKLVIIYNPYILAYSCHQDYVYQSQDCTRLLFHRSSRKAHHHLLLTKTSWSHCV